MKYLSILLFLSICLTSFGQDRENSTLVKIGQQVPSFSYTDENNDSQSIENLKGKVVMINFFATWCGPCLKELPHVQTEIFDKYKDDSNFKLLIFGREHSQDEVEKFKNLKGYSFPIYGDPERKIYSKFASNFIPRNFIVDENGKIIYSSIGFNDQDFSELKKIIAEELK